MAGPVGGHGVHRAGCSDDCGAVNALVFSLQIDRGAINLQGSSPAVVGHSDVVPEHQRVTEQGGHLRSGLEDTFSLADGTIT